MTDGHCFISYSGADALKFATNLSDELQGKYPFINMWLDKRELEPTAEDWDDQLASAISGCKCLIFVMTMDSTAKGSVCKAEWTWAMKCKKPIITILLDKNSEVPFRLNNHQHIDFSNYENGLARLRTAISRLDSPEGELDQLKQRLTDAQRDLRRARPDDQPRIKAELDELTEQIKRQEEIVRNPRAAEEKTEKNIQSGLERERQPEKPVAGKTSTRFINPPPGIAPNYFQDRLIETEQIRDFLNNDSQRLLTIVGRAGVGKTAMVCRLLKALERGELPDDLGEMKVDGIVYLSETGSHRVNFANVFADLSKLLPKDDAERLEGIYKNPQTSTGDKMRALLDTFPSGRVILLLDNFETLIDPESLSLRDSELSEALNALLGGQHHAVKAVITTRIAPRDLAVSEPGRQHPLSLDEGLESPYAENVLREMDADGRVGLKSAPDALLKVAREKTRGYPRALEALYAILSVDRYTTLEELLELSLPDEVVQKLVGEAFNRLDPSAQKVMQALAVYNRPVSPAAIDYLLQPHLPSIDSALVLNRLVNMHFARREAGRYYLHPADREYAFGIILEGEKTIGELETPDFELEETDSEEQVENTEEVLENENEETSDVDASKVDLEELFKQFSFRQSRTDFTRYGLLDRAADYFAQARKPRAEWKKLDDLSAQLAEFDLRCASGDYDTAASVLGDIDFDYLDLWGHYRLMIDLRTRLKNKIADKKLSIGNLNGLARAHRSIGKITDSISYLNKGLDIALSIKNLEWEGVLLGNLGGDYNSLGNIDKAIETSQQALTSYKKVGSRTGEARTLIDLGNQYSKLGITNKAIEYYEQALVITREIGDHRDEGITLGNLGNRYTDLGDTQKAIGFYKRSFDIFHEIGNRSGEGVMLSNLAGQYSNLAEYEKAIVFYDQALQNAREIGNKYGESKRLNGLAGVLIEKGDLQNAIKHSQESLQIGQEMSSPEVCSGSGSTLAQAYLFQDDLVNARATIETALQYDEPENNHNVTALHGIIALRQGESETAQEAFAKSIAQADEILAKTPDYYSALDAKGIALSGLVVSGKWEVDGKRQKVLDEAVETFRKARKIAPHAGVVKSVLRLFDELVKCDEEGVLKDVRKAVEGVE